MTKQKTLSTSRNALYNTIGSLTYLACQWLITLLVVRLGNVEDAGVLSVCMSMTNVFFTLCTFGMRTYMVSDRQGKYSDSLYFSTRAFCCFCSLAICVIASVLSADYTSSVVVCIALYMLFRIGEAIVDMQQAVQQRAERMDYICVSFLLRGIGTVCAFSLTLWLTGSLLLAIAAMGLVTFAVIFCYDGSICRRLTTVQWTWQPKSMAELLWETTPLMLNSLLSAAMVSIPRLRLEALFGSYTMGIYASVATPAVIVQSAAIWLYAPSVVILTKYWTGKDKKSYKQHVACLLGILVGIFALACAGASLLGKWGLNLLFGQEIAAHAALLPAVLMGTGLIALSMFLSALLTIARKLW